MTTFRVKTDTSYPKEGFERYEDHQRSGVSNDQRSGVSNDWKLGDTFQEWVADIKLGRSINQSVAIGGLSFGPQIAGEFQKS